MAQVEEKRMCLDSVSPYGRQNPSSARRIISAGPRTLVKRALAFAKHSPEETVAQRQAEVGD